jgi:hypothetical protein
LIASIEDADREISELMRNIEPGEETRLETKIAALGGEEQAPLRTLLEQQLDIVRGLAVRVDDIQEKRNRRVELLKTLALHVASLRSRAVQTPSAVRMASDEVRALCDDIARQVAALGAAPAVAGDAPTVHRREQ